MSCDTAGGLLTYLYIKKAMTIIMIIAPMILLVLGTIDFMGAVTAGDEKGMRKSIQTFLKRILICVVILLLPYIIGFIMSFATRITKVESKLLNCIEEATDERVAELEAKEENERKSILEKYADERKKREEEQKKLEEERKKQEEEKKEQEEKAKKGDRSYTYKAGDPIPELTGYQGGSYTSGTKTRSGMIGIASSQIGVKEEPTRNNDVKYNRWFYGHPVGDEYAWCAVFVSWVANENGVLNDKIPKFNRCPDGVKWFKEKGQWRDKNYTPKSGDIIFFDWSGSGSAHHVAIVEYVDSQGVVHYIGGNEVNDVRRVTANAAKILGYGVPSY